MFRGVLNNSCTNVGFFICKYFNKIEIGSKFGGKIGMRYCRKEVVLWGICKMKIVIILNWEMCNFRRFVF